MTNQPESPLTKKIRWVLTHAREAYSRKEQYTRKWDALEHGGEIHIQFIATNSLRLAIARIGKTPEDKALDALHTELDTLIKYWPEGETNETGDRKLTPTDESGRYWLVTTLTIVHQPNLL